MFARTRANRGIYLFHIPQPLLPLWLVELCTRAIERRRVDVCKKPKESAVGSFTVPPTELPGLEYLTGVVFGNLSGLDLAGSLDIRTRAMQILFALETMWLRVWGLG